MHLFVPMEHKVLGRRSPKAPLLGRDDPEAKIAKVREETIAKAKLERNKRIISNRSEAHDMAMEIVTGTLTSDCEATPQLDLRLASAMSNGIEASALRTAFSSYNARGEGEGDDEMDDEENEREQINEQDQLIRLFGREAFDELMIEIERVLMSEDEDIGAEEPGGDEFEEEELRHQWEEEWDDTSMVVCPICRVLPMVVDPVSCVGVCSCSAPIPLTGLAQHALQCGSTLKEALEAVLADEYERFVRFSHTFSLHVLYGLSFFLAITTS